MHLTGAGTNILHVHPLRRCNLRCLHCYSSSGPEASAELPGVAVIRALKEAARLGYTVMSVSGGEPLMYSALASLLARAGSLGMQSSIVTNGTLLDARRIELIAPWVSTIALSIDGSPAHHNTMRADSRAFDRMALGLDGLRTAGLRFGLVFTLTAQNTDDLPWVVQFAEEHGASFVQVHPLEMQGRAVTDLAGESPDDVDLAFILALVAALQQRYLGRVALQCDVSSLAQIEVALESATKRLPQAVATGNLGEFLSPLVLEAEGTFSPLQFGFPRRHRIGNIDASLETQAARWLSERASEFLAHCTRALAREVVNSPTGFVSPYRAMSAVPPLLLT